MSEAGKINRLKKYKARIAQGKPLPKQISKADVEAMDEKLNSSNEQEAPKEAVPQAEKAVKKEAKPTKPKVPVHKPQAKETVKSSLQQALEDHIKKQNNE